MAPGINPTAELIKTLPCSAPVCHSGLHGQHNFDTPARHLADRAKPTACWLIILKSV
jgi:hypothetical protein